MQAAVMSAPKDPRQFPAPGELADEDDELGWDREQHGRMLNEQAPDDAVKTVGYAAED